VHEAEKRVQQALDTPNASRQLDEHLVVPFVVRHDLNARTGPRAAAPTEPTAGYFETPSLFVDVLFILLLSPVARSVVVFPQAKLLSIRVPERLIKAYVKATKKSTKGI
jgi:hypothetical protein